MENLERNTNVVYELNSNRFGRKFIQEPKGASNDIISYSRDTDSRGFTSKVQVNLEFFGDGAEYLTNAYESLGIEERIILVKYERNKSTLSEEFKIRYIQELDMGTYKLIERTGNVTVEATQGGLFDDIKNRENDEYDLFDNLSADEIDIGELSQESFQPIPRKIFIESKLEGDVYNYEVRARNTGNVSYNSRALPLKLIYTSDGEDVVTPLNVEPSDVNFASHQRIENSMGVGNPFFFQAERNKVLDIRLDAYAKIVSDANDTLGGGHKWKLEYQKGSNVDNILTITENEVLFESLDFSIGNEFNVNFNRQVQVDAGESLAFVLTIELQESNIGGFSRDGERNVKFNSKNTLIIEDVTAYSAELSVVKCVKPLVLFDRIVAKITGKTGLVKSSIFENGGEHEYKVINNGLMARGFPQIYKNSSDEDQEIQLVTSFSDAFDAFNYIEPLCWFTEIIGTTEYIRIEKATYTQQNFIGIKLGDVDNINKESSKPDYFSTITLGHSRSVEYEELNGLDESNGKSNFTTFITKNQSEYESLSKFRTDAIGYELTRRKPFISFPKEDTKRDTEIWIHDAKKLPSGVITHKSWDEIFDSLPKGIYDPESSWNLDLSPMNRLYYGHGYSIKRGLYHYPKRSIRFNSSNANKNLITVKNGFELSEGGSILIEDIPSARVEATKITLTFSMTQELEDAFNGTVNINNLEVPNYFGLIEYIERGEKKYGRLISLDADEEAKLTLIKARI